jgi:hypothetical protein
VVTLYPVPIAITYRRFCQETHPRSRLEALFFVLEASVRYLVTLGVSDLFQYLAASGGDPGEALAHADFEFRRRPRPMLLGKWVGALRETARALSAVPPGDRLVPGLPDVCRPGGTLDADLLAWLVGRRNENAHADGSIRPADEQCREVLREYRPRLEETLREMGFVCRYPLGFVTPFAGLSAAPGEHDYQPSHASPRSCCRRGAAGSLARRSAPTACCPWWPSGASAPSTPPRPSTASAWPSR